MTVESKHQGGASPMEQFILLAKGAKGMAASELVKQALEAPGIYVFSELMDVPSIKELQSIADLKSTWELLNIFAYGTYKDYLQSKERLALPNLSASQLRKLQHLTIVSLAEKEKSIHYSVLQEELGISDIRDLEDVIIEAIYAEIVEGKLDQCRTLLEIDNTIGRDIKPEDMDTIISTLDSWCDACENVLASLQSQMDKANIEKSQKRQRKEQLEQEINNLRKTVRTHPVDSDEMIVDSREAMGVERTPAKKTIKKGFRGSKANK